MYETSAWPQVVLADVIVSARPGFASGERSEEGVIQFRMNNVDRSGNISWNKLTRIPCSKKNISTYQVHPGDVLFNQTNSRDLVGKTALFLGHKEPIVFSNHFLRLRSNPTKLDGGYLARYLQSLFRTGFFEKKCNAWVNQATYGKDDLLAQRIPLPPFDEQRRIAAVLDKADAIRRKYQQALALADEFLRAAFLETFGDPVTNPRQWDLAKLESLGEIKGGLQVTSARDSNPIRLPYLRVANVYRNRLELDEIKEIGVTEREARHALLEVGDILIVEGHGNLKELGRSAVWRGAVVNCTHQNHLIRCRADKSKVDPTYLCAFLNSNSGRRQLLSAGKTTSGLNTINTRNVRELQILVPPLEIQECYTRMVKKSQDAALNLNRMAQQANDIFVSITKRAFSGTL